MKTQEELFEFLNRNCIKYIVLRGSDEESRNKGKDLDILILKKDYDKLKKEGYPKTDRMVHFYIDKEKHWWVTFVDKKAMFRRKFNKEKGFFILSSSDYLRMIFLRKILKIIREIKRFWRYEK